MGEIKRIKVNEIPHYYMDDRGKLCYQNKDGEWFNCKKVDNKPGWVWVYLYGKKSEYNEVSLAIKYIKDYKKVENKPKVKKVSEKRELDKRYKEGVDTGDMSHLSIPLPLKPVIEEKKKLNDEPKQYARLRWAKKRNKKK
jgi:hypothetical protein